MPRVVSVFFPTLSVDRIRKSIDVPADKPLVVISRNGSKRWLSAVDANARKFGLHVGLPASKAQAMVAGLITVDGDPAADAAIQERLALWCLRQYSPIVAVDGADGIVMDTEGADHLHGGEHFMVTGLVNTARARGLNAKAAIADTLGLAHALARFATDETTIVAPGEIAKTAVGLPLHALRLPSEIVRELTKLGFVTVGELAATARAPLALRFGPTVGRRLDQMMGRVVEPIDPIRTEDMVVATKGFAEPIAAAETIAKYVRRLADELTLKLEARGLGVRRVDLLISRVDNIGQALRTGFAKPVRDSKRLSKLLCDRIDQIDPGFGIERVTLTAIVAEPLEEVQMSSVLIEETVNDVTPVVDILGNRGARLYRVTPIASDLPERSVARVDPTSPESGLTWQVKWPRPPRLLPRPEQIDVMALLPDQPPVVITWRGKRRRIVRADGPERVFGEWWHTPLEFHSVRDYFSVEDDNGERYWIYRAGDGVDGGTGNHKWFLHGMFA